jgi:hypothetical protein
MLLCRLTGSQTAGDRSSLTLARPRGIWSKVERADRIGGVVELAGDRFPAPRLVI